MSAASSAQHTAALVHDAASLGVALTEHDALRLLRLLQELVRWNRRFNLTAIRHGPDMVTHHLLDSLAVHRYLQGDTVADVGTGAGFPGLPLALANPERRFTLIDSNGKKTRFVSHALRTLGLVNAEALQARVEALCPERPFDTVVARAFAPLPEMLALIGPLCGPKTRVLAMKGKWTARESADLPAGWLAQWHPLTVPGLEQQRSVICLTASPSWRSP